MAELYLPQATDWIGALEAGQKAGMTDRKLAAASSAARLMTGGDYQGAAGALYGAGDFQSGSAVANAGYQQTEQKLKLQRQQGVQGALAKGDFTSAYAAAGSDKDMLEGLDKVWAHAKDTTNILAAGLQALKGPDGQWLQPDEARLKLQEIGPSLIARGLDPKMINGFDPTPANLEAVQSQALGLKDQLDRHKPVTLGTQAFDPVTGKELFHGRDIKAVTKSSGGQVLVDANNLGGGPSDADGAPAPAAASPSAPIPTDGVYATVGQAASGAGAKPEEVSYLQRLAQVESSGDPKAQNGSSTGLFQFHPDTFAAAGGHGDIHDVGQQTQAALNLSRQDRARLQQLGVDPNDANTYIMHQQGAPGGTALLSAPPDMNAIQALTPVYQKKFGAHAPDVAKAAIVNNGGTADMSAGQFTQMWRDRWANGGTPVSGGQAAAPGAPGGKQPGVLFDSDTLDNGDGALSDDTVKVMAARYIADGTIPALGMKTATDRRRILNEATKQMKELGLTAGDLVAGTANTKALAGALAKNEATKQQVQGAEGTALRNADLALSLAPTGGAKGQVPILNRWIQAGRKSIAGDPEVAKFDLALGTFADEYAKVVAGQNGATDSVRAEAYHRINGAMTQDQLKGVIATMRREMANRTLALEATSTGLNARLRNGGAAVVAQPEAAPAPAPGGPIDLSRYRK